MKIMESMRKSAVVGAVKNYFTCESKLELAAKIAAVAMIAIGIVALACGAYFLGVVGIVMGAVSIICINSFDTPKKEKKTDSSEPSSDLKHPNLHKEVSLLNQQSLRSGDYKRDEVIGLVSARIEVLERGEKLHRVTDEELFGKRACRHRRKHYYQH